MRGSIAKLGWKEAIKRGTSKCWISIPSSISTHTDKSDTHEIDSKVKVHAFVCATQSSNLIGSSKIFHYNHTETHPVLFRYIQLAMCIGK